MASGWDEITALYNFPNPHRGSKAWLDEGWIVVMVAIAGLDRSRSVLAKLHYQARALRAQGLLLADGTPTVGGGKTF